MIASDLRVAPVRDLIQRRGRRQQMRLLLSLEALQRQALRAAVTAQSVLLPTPAFRALVCIEEGLESLASEPVVAHALCRSLLACLVACATCACRIHYKAPCLRMLEEGWVDTRTEWIGQHHDRLGVVRQQHMEDAAEEQPGLLARLDRTRRGLV